MPVQGSCLIDADWQMQLEVCNLTSVNTHIIYVIDVLSQMMQLSDSEAYLSTCRWTENMADSDVK